MRRSPGSDGPEALDAVDREVGRRLRLRRTLMGLSQERLGELLGVTFQQIQKYEGGTNRIGAGRLWRLARILEIPIGWFFEELERASGDQRPSAGPGLAEPGFGFVFDPPRRPAAPAAAAPAAVDRRETLELVRAFNAIPDPALRRRLYELVRAVSEASAGVRPGERGSA